MRVLPGGELESHWVAGWRAGDGLEDENIGAVAVRQNAPDRLGVAAREAPRLAWARSAPQSPLVGEVYVAQRPPRRYTVRLGNVVDLDRDLATFEADVATELALVGGYVLGDTRLYDVAGTESGCFRAELVEPVAASPWGIWAEYCFDDGTGVLTSARVRRQSATDVEEISAIRTEVTDADFG